MPDLTQIVFGVIALAMVVAAVAMVQTRNVVHSAYWLFANAVLTAAIFGMLHANYVAVIQLLVYAGAVAILTIFTVMLTLRHPDFATRPREFNLFSLLLAGALLALIVLALFTSPEITQQQVQEFPGVREFAIKMFAPDGWALPFEIASLILTAALITAVMWTHQLSKRRPVKKNYRSKGNEE